MINYFSSLSTQQAVTVFCTQNSTGIFLWKSLSTTSAGLHNETPNGLCVCSGISSQTICLHENFSIAFPQEGLCSCIWSLWSWTWNSIKLSQNTEAQVFYGFAKVFVYIPSSSLWDLVEEEDWHGDHHGDICDQWLGFWVCVWGGCSDVFLRQVWVSHSFSLCLVCLWVL